MTYKEWLKEYLSLRETEEDQWVCNWDRAEIKSNQREQMREELPEYWEHYLKGKSMKEQITDFSFIGDKNKIKSQIIDLVNQKRDFDAYNLYVFNDVLFDDDESSEIENFIVETNMEKDYITQMGGVQYERSL